MEKIFQANGPKKQVSTDVLISKNTDLKQKLINRAREGYYIPIKGEIHEENIAILNIYFLNTREPKFIKETLRKLKLHTDSHTLIFGNFNMSLLPTSMSSRQKLNREMLELNAVLNEGYLQDTYLKHKRI